MDYKLYEDTGHIPLVFPESVNVYIVIEFSNKELINKGVPSHPLSAVFTDNFLCPWYCLVAKIYFLHEKTRLSLVFFFSESLQYKIKS